MHKNQISTEAQDIAKEGWEGNGFFLSQSIDPRTLLTTILDSSDNTIITTTLDGIITSWNEGARRMYGYSPSEVLGKSISIVFPADKKGELPNIFETIKQGNRITELESVRTAKDGTPLFVSINISPIKNSKGEIIGILGVTRNITRSKQLEMALRQSEEKFSKAFLTSPDSILITRLNDGLFIEINQGFTQLTGYTAEDVRGKTTRDIDIWVDIKDRDYLIEQVRKNGEFRNFEANYRRKNGEIGIMQISARMIEIQGEQCLLTVTHDITDIKTAEQALRESEDKYRQLFDLESDAIFLIENESGQILEVNTAAISLYGYNREELLQKKNTDLSAEPSETRQATVRQDKWVPIRFHRKKDGTVFPVEITAKHFTWKGRAVHIAAIRDITERNRAEDALRESERTLSNLLSNLQGMVYRGKNDRDRTMLFVSQGCQELTGYLPVDLVNSHSLPYGKLIHPDDREKVWQEIQQAIQGKRSFQLHYRIKTRPAEEKWVWEQGLGVFSEDGELLAVEGFITDVTEQKRAEDALLESHERFLTVIDSIDLNIYVADMDTYEILLVNERMKKDFGEELIGKVCWKTFRNEKGPCSICSNEKLLDADGNPTGVHIWEGRNPITGRWYINFDRAIKWVDGRIVRLQIATDITERKEMEEKLQYLINHDPLTGLYNRFYFEEEISRLENSRQHPVSIIAIDIDGLKNVNDTHGHAAGDKLLKQTAFVLQASFRTEDVVARIGGDEFEILLPKTNHQSAQEALRRLRKNLLTYNRENPDFPLKLSLGVATSENNKSLIDVLMEADHRMYEDKLSK